jgi:hypothetical protein
MSIEPMNFTRTPQTDVLVEMFASTAPGDLLEYAQIERELQRRLGIRVPTWRNVMSTVVKYLRREHKIIIRAEPRVGYRHLADVDVLTEADRDRRKSHRHNKRALEKQFFGYKQPDALTPEQQMKRTTAMSILSTIVQFTTTGARKLRDPKPANTARIASGVVPFAPPKKR